MGGREAARSAAASNFSLPPNPLPTTHLLQRVGHVLVAAQRFRVSGRMNGEQPPFEYLAIYEIEAEDVDHALARLSEASEKMVISDAIDLNDTNVFCVRALGPRISI